MSVYRIFRSNRQVKLKRTTHKGHRMWSAFAGVMVFGVCMYLLLDCIFPMLGRFGAVIRQTENNASFSCLRDSLYSRPEAKLHANYSNFYLSTTNQHNIGYSFHQNWVGFPNFSHIDCFQPLNYPTLNRLYPSHLQRTYPSDFLEDTKDCMSFVNKYGYTRHPVVSQEELDFPIAFVLLFHRDLDQVQFLLRAIYHPHNVYCLLVDTKSSIDFMDATRSIARCLPNVFMSSKLESVVYAGYSRLMADLHCFEDLSKHPVQWKYLINSPGQAFPLRTNLEMVRILKLFNGTNDIEAKTGSEIYEDRFLTKWKYVRNVTSGEKYLKKTSITHAPPPHGLEIVKCSAYGAFTRPFVEFVITNQIAKDLLEWVKPVFSPDELFWATLNYNTVVPAPGGFAGVPKETLWLTSFSVWDQGQHSPCVTKFVRGVCIFSPADLPMLVKRHELFANKFHINHHPVALHCLDQLIYNLTFSRKVRDMQVYVNMNLSHRTTKH